MLTVDDHVQVFSAHAATEEGYCATTSRASSIRSGRFLARWDRSRGNRLLDVGAHWLHQALLYARDGFEVTAPDLPATLEMANVRAVAQAHAIRLLPNADLEHPRRARGNRRRHVPMWSCSPKCSSTSRSIRSRCGARSIASRSPVRASC